ncbi:hypothetical protein SJAV_10290 [Sulfurisphaera javensis]|uniref:Uncharacterized protein n=1 Tax=Sulfurisphaera javensis TaxID=2049879 RepID=A0AAT9GQ66_9CREN
MVEMLPLILTAILSLGVIEGVNPHKGLLFSYYFFSFKKVKESYLLPFFITFFYYLIGILIIVLIRISHSIISELILLYMIYMSIGMKLIMGNFIHYNSSIKPKILNVIKWSLINSILNMNVIYPIIISYFSNLFFILYFISNLLTRELIFCISKNIPLNLSRYNLDYLEILILLILSVFILVLTFCH